MTSKKSQDGNYSIPTKLIYGKSVAEEWDYSHHVIPPITTSSSFRLDSAGRGAKGFGQIGRTGEGGPIYVYDRMGEPTVDMLQDALATAEGCDIAVTFATGMAAIHAALCFYLEPGSEIISHSTVYGCTYSLMVNWLPKFGFKVHFCDLTDPKSFLPFVNDKTRLIFLESPVNPTLQLLDTQAIIGELNKVNAKRAANNKIISVMDNTFSTPFCQRPAEHGVDVVVHSLTKGLSGFGTDMGGAVITRQEFQERLILFRKDFGGTLSPQPAWHILVYGLSTLSLRIPHQQANAQKIAEFLEKHKLVERVSYPGLDSFPQKEIARRHLIDYDGNFAPGIIIYFTLGGRTPEESKRKGEQMMDYIAKNAYAITLAVSLGQVRTLIEHPGSMTHAAYPADEQVKLGIDPGGIRLAVGIEHPDDVIKDLTAALQHIESAEPVLA
ncbi:MAG TPA: PLP-dependent transferase [Oculatellaceae cyanobacterium]